MDIISDITLIVKASNQQFEDQTIKCEPSWTIRRLKGHLTEVHPGKPTSDEQKLIYSGQLLGDNVVLKDILRHYDGQQTHTVHLVFTPKNNRHQKDFSFVSSSGGGGSSSSNNSTKTMAPKANSEAAATSTATNARTEQVRAAEAGSSATIGADGLRQRNVAGSQNTSNVGMATMTASPVAPPSADYIMGQQLAMQNWMQQAYMQYLNQYMNVISSGQNNPQALYASAPTNPSMLVAPQPSPQTVASLGASNVDPNPILAQTLPNLAYYPYLSTMNSLPMPSASSIPAPITSSGTIPTSPAPAGVTPGPSSQSAIAGSSAAPAAGPNTDGSSGVQSSTAAATVDGAAQAQTVAAGGAGAAPAPGAAAAPARRFPNIVVEEQENRDWLDIFFSMCRVGILMTVVYLYSSPTRCLTVFFIGISLYLYQIGFFRNNNAERLERARQIVVQQINNAHGIRPNAIPRARAAPAGEEAAEAAAIAQAATPDTVPSPAATTTDSTDSPPKIAAEKKENITSCTSTDSTTTTVADKDSPTTTPTPTVEEPSAELEELEDQTTLVPEANRVNVNDVAAFLRTLVLSFFTSIIPDTPAA